MHSYPGVSLPGLVIVGPRLAGASVNAVMPVSGGPPSRLSVRQIGMKGTWPFSLTIPRVLSIMCGQDNKRKMVKDKNILG